MQPSFRLVHQHSVIASLFSDLYFPVHSNRLSRLALPLPVYNITSNPIPLPQSFLFPQLPDVSLSFFFILFIMSFVAWS